MITAILLYCFLYVGLLVFLAGCLARIFQYARAPVHLRWELYPVPEGPSGQLKVMIPEILLLKGLREANRALWRRSFPFHLGLYLLAATAVLFAVALPATGTLHGALRGVYEVTGWAGLTLALFGALALLSRRLADKELRAYTTAGDVFNLLSFAITLTLVAAGRLFAPPGSPGPSAILRGAVTFDTSLQPPMLLVAGLMAGSALLAYIPMTHMAHFIAKYFTYHAVRWDDHPTTPGGGIERRMAEYLTYRPTWSARHMGADGVRTWADIATTNPAKGGAK